MTVENRAGQVVGNAAPATCGVTDKPTPAEKRLRRRIAAGKSAQLAKNTSESTAAPGDSASTSTSTPTSNSSAEPSRPLKKRWQTPKNVREFAGQANQITTMLLNGEIDLETARTYASLARVVSQTCSIEVTRSRFLKQAPDLSLE